MINSLILFHYEKRLAATVKPRTRIYSRAFANWDSLLDSGSLMSLEKLSGIIGDLEHDGKGVPVLLRQYIKLGGKIVAFSKDKDFSDCIDGLMVVDLRRTRPDLLLKYLGADGLLRFSDFHHLHLVTPKSIGTVPI
jgi:hypothetical protein